MLQNHSVEKDIATSNFFHQLKIVSKVEKFFIVPRHAVCSIKHNTQNKMFYANYTRIFVGEERA